MNKMHTTSLDCWIDILFTFYGNIDKENRIHRVELKEKVKKLIIN